jgi:hypothetical protein
MKKSIREKSRRKEQGKRGEGMEKVKEKRERWEDERNGRA